MKGHGARTALVAVNVERSLFHGDYVVSRGRDIVKDLLKEVYCYMFYALVQKLYG